MGVFLFIKYLYQMDNIITLSNVKLDSNTQQRWDKILDLGYMPIPLSIAKAHGYVNGNNVFDTGLETVVKFEENKPIAPLETTDGIPYVKFKGQITDSDIGEIMVNLDDYGDLRVDKVVAMKEMDFDDTGAHGINEWKNGPDRAVNKIDKLTYKDHLPLIEKIATKLNLKVIKLLGKGANGIAYLIDGGRVLKITTDASEVLESYKIVGKNTTHIAKIFSVFKLNTKIDPSMQGVIICEQVKTDPQFFAKLLREMGDLYEDLSPLDQLEYLDDIFTEYIQNNGKEYVNRFNVAENLLLNNPEGLDVNHISDIFNIYREMKSYKVTSIDVRDQNLGFNKNNKIVYFDLGVGEIHGQEPEHKLKIK